MKKLLVLLTITMSIIACNTDSRTKLPQAGLFGTAFDTTNSMQVQDLDDLLNVSNPIGLKVSGTIAQYCKGEGCWLTLKNPDGEEVLVEVKDKAFVLPYNIENKTAFVNGAASRSTSEDGKSLIKIEADGIILQ